MAYTSEIKLESVFHELSNDNLKQDNIVFKEKKRKEVKLFSYLKQLKYKPYSMPLTSWNKLQRKG